MVSVQRRAQNRCERKPATEHGIRIAHPMGVGVLDVNVWRLSMVKRPAECSGTSGKSGVVSDMAFDS